MPATTLTPGPVTAASVVKLLDGIERHGTEVPAAIAFHAALRRKGLEADAAGGLAALDALMAAVAEADDTCADPRIAILRTAGAHLLPGPGASAHQ